jgi:hypothetical protein
MTVGELMGILQQRDPVEEIYLLPQSAAWEEHEGLVQFEAQDLYFVPVTIEPRRNASPAE